MIQFENIVDGKTPVIRYYDTKKGESFYRPITYKPKLYVKSPNPNAKYRYILDQSIMLDEKTFDSVKESNDYKKQFASMDNKPFYGETKPKYQFIRDHFYFKEEGFHNDLNIWYIDIETEIKGAFESPYLARNPITLIQYYDNHENIYYVYSFKEEYENKDLEKELNAVISHMCFKDEVTMLLQFADDIKEKNPAAMVAWNGEKYDYPYLYNRYERLKLGAKRLSPIGMVNKKELRDYSPKMVDGEVVKEYTYRFEGIYLLDLMVMYKKFTFVTQTSYSLSNIAKVELGDDKVNYEEFDNLQEVYDKDYKTFVDYGIKDVELIKEIDAKHSLSSLMIMIAFKMGIPMDEALGTVTPWGIYVINTAYSKGMICPNDGGNKVTLSSEEMMEQFIKHEQMDIIQGVKDQKKKKDKYVEFFQGNVSESQYQKVFTRGAWVEVPEKGKHKYIISVDWASLYPLILIMNNLSAEKILHDDEIRRDPTLSEICDFLKGHQDSEGIQLQKDFNKDSLVQGIKDGLRKNVYDTFDKMGEYESYLKEKNLSCSVNGVFTKNDEIGFIPTMVKDIFLERKTHKKKMIAYNVRGELIKGFLTKDNVNTESTTIKNPLEYTESDISSMNTDDLKTLFDKCEYLSNNENTEQMTRKILINSLYGSLGNQHFVLYNVDVSNAITAGGRFYNQLVLYKIDDLLRAKSKIDKPYLVYGDTDSGYFSLENIVENHKKLEGKSVLDKISFCDSFYEKIIQPKIQEYLMSASDRLNVFDKDAMSMDREIIADCGIFVAKKKYITRVFDNEGVVYDIPKTKIMGLEIIRSSTPAFSRKYLKDAIPMLLDMEQSDLTTWLVDVKDKFFEADVADIGKVSGVSNLSFDLHKSKSIPIASRASLVHNYYITKNKKLSKFNLITTEDKIKLVYLKQPNPCGNQDCVGFVNPMFIEEEGLSEYLDKEIMWEKYFLKPLQIMIDSLGWTTDTIPSIDMDEW